MIRLPRADEQHVFPPPAVAHPFSCQVLKVISRLLVLPWSSRSKSIAVRRNDFVSGVGRPAQSQRVSNQKKMLKLDDCSRDDTTRAKTARDHRAPLLLPFVVRGWGEKT